MLDGPKCSGGKISKENGRKRWGEGDECRFKWAREEQLYTDI